MGYMQRLESRNSGIVASVMRRVNPSLNVYLKTVPCNLVAEEHVGLEIDLESGSQVFLHRCQMKWWCRVQPSDNRLDPDIPIEMYRLSLTQAFEMDVPWKPQHAGIVLGNTKFD